MINFLFDLEAVMTYIVLPIISLSAILIGIRFIKGPKIADRILCTDMLFTLGAAFIAGYSIKVKSPLFLDIALLFSLIAFLGTIAFSYYLVSREKNNTRKK